ncbi:hypothetical protein GCM10022199_08640 [Marihabitans asiaticum]
MGQAERDRRVELADGGDRVALQVQRAELCGHLGARAGAADRQDAHVRDPAQQRQLRLEDRASDPAEHDGVGAQGRGDRVEDGQRGVAPEEAHRPAPAGEHDRDHERTDVVPLVARAADDGDPAPHRGQVDGHRPHMPADGVAGEVLVRDRDRAVGPLLAQQVQVGQQHRADGALDAELDGRPAHRCRGADLVEGADGLVEVVDQRLRLAGAALLAGAVSLVRAGSRTGAQLLDRGANRRAP